MPHRGPSIRVLLKFGTDRSYVYEQVDLVQQSAQLLRHGWDYTDNEDHKEEWSEVVEHLCEEIPP